MDVPVGNRRGIVDHGRETVRDTVLTAWDDFLAVAGRTDLDAGCRLPGWRAHEVCVRVGRWSDHDAFTAALESTRHPPTWDPPDAEAADERVTRAHRDASREEVLAALTANRVLVESYFQNESPETDRALGNAPMGPLPFLSILHGQTFELAVAALDLVSAGGPVPPSRLLQTGIAAMVDVTGALAARLDLHGRMAVLDRDDGGWGFDADSSGWQTRAVPGPDRRHPYVLGEASVLLDAGSGRNNPLAQLASGHIRVHRLRGLLALAPIVEGVPGLPGGRTLAMAARTLSGAGGTFHRIQDRRRRP